MWVFEFYTAFIEKCVMHVLCCYELSVVRISPRYKGKNGSLVPIGHKGRFLPLENSKKCNVK